MQARRHATPPAQPTSRLAMCQPNSFLAFSAALGSPPPASASSPAFCASHSACSEAPAQEAGQGGQTGIQPLMPCAAGSAGAQPLHWKPAGCLLQAPLDPGRPTKPATALCRERVHATHPARHRCPFSHTAPAAAAAGGGAAGVAGEHLLCVPPSNQGMAQNSSCCSHTHLHAGARIQQVVVQLLLPSAKQDSATRQQQSSCALAFMSVHSSSRSLCSCSTASSSARAGSEPSPKYSGTVSAGHGEGRGREKGKVSTRG